MSFLDCFKQKRKRKRTGAWKAIDAMESLELRMLPAVLTYPFEEFPTFEGSGSMDGSWNRGGWATSATTHSFWVNEYGYDWSFTSESGNDIWFASRLNGHFTIEPQNDEQIGDKVKVTVTASFSASSGAYESVTNENVSFTAALQDSVFMTKTLSGDFPNDSISGSASAILEIGDTFTASYLMQGSGHAPDFYPSFRYLGPEGTVSYTLTVQPYVEADISVSQLNWNYAAGGVDVQYGFTLPTGDNTTTSHLELYWSAGSSVNEIIGSPLDTLPLNSGTASSGVWHVGSDRIGVPPSGATHLIAIADRDDSLEEAHEDNNYFAWQHNLAGQSLLKNKLNALYPAYTDINELEAGFRQNVENFRAALAAAGIKTTVFSTYRPPERAYLMHYAWLIAKNRLSDEHLSDASQIPTMPGVDINWDYKNAQLTRQAAQEMLAFFDIGSNLKTAPALRSRHTARLALDMDVSWSGTKSILNASGKAVTIRNNQGSAALNPKLIKLAATYGVIHFHIPSKDKTHWSNDGQ